MFHVTSRKQVRSAMPYQGRRIITLNLIVIPSILIVSRGVAVCLICRT